MSLQRDEDSTDQGITLFDISWDDVLFERLFPLLSLEDLFTLRCCSKLCKEFVERGLKYRKSINLAGKNEKNIDLTCSVLAKCCRNLEYINLARCLWLNDDLLVKLLENNGKLISINLNECEQISPIGLQPIIVQCMRLKVLKLSKCHWLTTGAIDALTLHHSCLEEFDISYCYQIGERCLNIFFRKLNNLKILSLGFTPSVTNVVLMQIGRFCKSLEHINLIGCEKISDLGVGTLLNQCKMLKSLMIQRCPRVTEEVLGPIRGKIFIDRPVIPYRFANVIQPRLYLQV